MAMTRVHGMLLAGVIFLLAVAVFSVSRPSGPPATDGSTPTAYQQNTAPPAREITRPPRRSENSRWKDLPELPPPAIPPHAPGSAENQEWITARIAELEDAAWFDDPESMRRILAELRSPLPEIRAAARAAITAFSSREAVPYLEMIASTTYEEPDRQELTEVIDFLKLPTITEQLEQQGANPEPEQTPVPEEPDADSGHVEN
jgi:hypothetical protein